MSQRNVASLETELAERQRIQQCLRRRKRQLRTQWHAGQVRRQPVLIFAGGVLAGAVFWTTLQTARAKRTVRALLNHWVDEKIDTLVRSLLAGLREARASRNPGHGLDEGK
ncbi:hypothetical protein NCG89_06610 [Spongiibacter taiwanensis]|uniref:hypothetical protein n=1 Tax=Spongiibacter taiwanensis TaxID=1748242 RepID=UPI0020353E30|nr:hypothetical protein [Spongiibacter taiwanensis]USA44440.1 hypothetical protein NCG89_06610 [Spongiibacter taiwanensis]